MTPEQILKADDKTLPAMAGKVLQPDAKHYWTNTGGIEHCKNCREMWNASKENTTCHCHIPLTPDNAFKWRDWAVEKYGAKCFMKAVETVGNECLGYVDESAFICFGDPIHYIKAAMLCVVKAVAHGK